MSNKETALAAFGSIVLDYLFSIDGREEDEDRLLDSAFKLGLVKRRKVREGDVEWGYEDVEFHYERK